MQLWRSFGFEAKIGERLARYNRMATDLVSFEYMLTHRNPIDQWFEEDLEPDIKKTDEDDSG